MERDRSPSRGAAAESSSPGLLASASMLGGGDLFHSLAMPETGVVPRLRKEMRENYIKRYAARWSCEQFWRHRTFKRGGIRSGGDVASDDGAGCASREAIKMCKR